MNKTDYVERVNKIYGRVEEAEIAAKNVFQELRSIREDMEDLPNEVDEVKEEE